MSFVGERVWWYVLDVYTKGGREFGGWSERSRCTGTAATTGRGAGCRARNRGKNGWEVNAGKAKGDGGQAHHQHDRGRKSSGKKKNMWLWWGAPCRTPPALSVLWGLNGVEQGRTRAGTAAVTAQKMAKGVPNDGRKANKRKPPEPPALPCSRAALAGSAKSVPGVV